ncbi:MAG: gliding motility protein GldM [Ekhidna sp.]
MAGGNETPRQKMIGMMYLVLTALLAMNVSTTVLDKFAFINKSLELANDETISRNSQAISGMKESVKDKGNRPEDEAVLKAAAELRAKTNEVFTSMEESKEEFIKITEGYVEGKEGNRMYIMGKENYDKVGHYMNPKEEGGEGKGEPMKKMLNEYATFVKDLLEKNDASAEELDRYKKLALDADEDEYWKQDPNQKGKKWSTLNFNHAPTHAALATLSEFQANVLGYETAAMDFLKTRVGFKDINFDQIRPVVMPVSKYVAAGSKYQAEMFIAASASGLNDKITMTYNGNKIPVADGTGTLEFSASAGASEYDKDGNAKKSFEAAITVPQGGGTDTTFSSTIEYYVVRPVIQIQSASVSALYYNCGNEMDVQVPALGTQYNPTFRAKGGDAIKGSTKGMVTVVPKSGKVALTVLSNGNAIGTREFGVRQIPAPDIKVFTDRGEVNLKDGISARTRKIYLRAIPDPSFAEFLPKDAKFIVAEAEVTLVSGGLGRGVSKGGGQINLGSGARKGDQLAIEIKKVQRQNFRKQVENFQKFTRFINVPLK